MVAIDFLSGFQVLHVRMELVQLLPGSHAVGVGGHVQTLPTSHRPRISAINLLHGDYFPAHRSTTRLRVFHVSLLDLGYVDERWW